MLDKYVDSTRSGVSVAHPDWNKRKLSPICVVIKGHLSTWRCHTDTTTINNSRNKSHSLSLTLVCLVFFLLPHNRQVSHGLAGQVQPTFSENLESSSFKHGKKAMHRLADLTASSLHWS